MDSKLITQNKSTLKRRDMLGFMGASLTMAVMGCQNFDYRSQTPDLLKELTGKSDNEKITDEDFDTDDFDLKTEVETPFIGDYVTVAGLNHILLEGVGLVVGLDGTGENPPPSMYVTALLDDMRRRGIKNPNHVLQSPNTALVVVRAYLPPLIQKGENFDIEVRLPPNSETTSLKGGRLLECYLSEQAIVPGQGVLEGHEFGRASGPILISTGVGDANSLAGVLRRGKILGGGLATREDRHLALYVRNDFRSVRNTRRIADRIGKRFHHYDKSGIKQPMAEAKTDQLIVLKVHPKYKDNFARYLQVIRNISFRETDVAERVRLQKLSQDLLDPEKADLAALRLEGIGISSLPILKSGLASSTLECRFHSAVALAYLDDPSGLPILTEAARSEPAFRVFALAAMATLDVPEAQVALRELMNEESSEVRYGSFRALWTMNRNDPFIVGRNMNDEFMLHVLPTDGSPLIHMTNNKRAEIVLYGENQRMLTPIAASAGNHIHINAAPGSNTIVVSRYEAGKPDRRREVSTRIADVIQTVAEFGASYPEVAQLLVEAEHQRNLIGHIEIDSLPKSGRIYVRPETQLADGTTLRAKKRIGRSKLAPNTFAVPDTEGELRQRESFREDASVDDDEGGVQQASFELDDLQSLEREAEPDQGNASLIDLTANSVDADSDNAGDAPAQSKSWWRWDVFKKAGKR
ncbi:MAG: flagellar basal body P-ring protein FlgI [Planctomycetota bacterium]|nr:flagellar basal body P-ring protein FlgI [Planctomycetota bacterium]